MAYSTIPKGSLHMNPKLYTGNGSTNAITGVGFQPDWVWIKKRNGTTSHVLTDIVRGITKQIYSNDTQAENTNSDTITAIGSDGFTLGNRADVNNNSDTYVAWNWKANGAGSANTAGSINSTVSVNTTAGFSVVSYTGDGYAGATVGHGLGAIPKFIIVKKLSGADSWTTYHASLGATKKINFDTGAAGTQSDRWNDTSPTDTLFSIGTNGSVNASGATYIAYCFADVQGYSKFSSYVGNGSTDGTFIYTGFKPSFVLIKNSSATADWCLRDDKRSPINVTQDTLFPNTADSESTGGTSYDIDFLSNGFKIRSTSSRFNTNGNTYIYMAFAENPFVATSGTSAIPVTAR